MLLCYSFNFKRYSFAAEISFLSSVQIRWEIWKTAEEEQEEEDG